MIEPAMGMINVNKQIDKNNFRSYYGSIKLRCQEQRAPLTSFHARSPVSSLIREEEAEEEAEPEEELMSPHHPSSVID